MPKRHSSIFSIRAEITKSTRIALGVIPFVVLLSVWAILSYGKIVAPLFLPTPTAVLAEIVELFSTGFLSDVGASVFRVLAGFLVSALVAVPLGILMGSMRSVEAAFTPFVAFVRYMPAAAFIPLLILWVGIGHAQKILLLFIGIFFYLIILVVDVVKNVPAEYIDAATTLGASRRQVLLNVIVPGSMPGIYDALRTMMGVGWTYIVVVEMVAATSGIGQMIMESQRFLQTGRVISGILTIGLIGLICDMLFRSCEPLLFKWVRKRQASA